MHLVMVTLDSPYIDRRIVQEADAFARAGHTVDILSPAGKPDRADDGVRFYCLPRAKGPATPPRSLTRFILKRFPFLEPLARWVYISFFAESIIPFEQAMLALGREHEADCYVAHDLSALPIAGRLAEEARKKLIYDSHEFFTGQSLLTAKERRFYRATERAWIGKADAVFTVNKSIAELLRESYGIPLPKVLMNAVPWARMPEPSGKLRRRLGLDRARKVVLYQGGFMPKRNLKTLAQAARSLDDDIVLVFLGWGPMENRLKREAEREGLLGRKVFFLEGVPTEDLQSYSSDADFGIIPYAPVDLNTRYCTPNKLFEFIASGVPVLYNKELLAVHALLEDKPIGAPLDMSSPAEMAREINAICSDRGWHERARRIMGQGPSFFPWDVQVQAMVALVEQLQRQ